MSKKAVRSAPQSSRRRAAADCINRALAKSDIVEICHAIRFVTRERPKAEIKAVPVQTAAPFGSSPSAITVGFYSVQDDVVVMHDGAGIPTGKRQHLRAGEDPRGADGGRKTIPPISGPTGLRGHRRSPPLGCPKLLWRPGQLTRSDGVRQSNRSVWSGFRPDMSEGAWQRPSS